MWGAFAAYSNTPSGGASWMARPCINNGKATGPLKRPALSCGTHDLKKSIYEQAYLKWSFKMASVIIV
jgi:hypothetical protein